VHAAITTKAHPTAKANSVKHTQSFVRMQNVRAAAAVRCTACATQPFTRRQQLGIDRAS
jgi:hypothetical protein